MTSVMAEMTPGLHCSGYRSMPHADVISSLWIRGEGATLQFWTLPFGNVKTPPALPALGPKRRVASCLLSGLRQT